MPRSAQPPITSSIALGRPSSTKKSAGPPMPNDVRAASGSSSLTPGSEASHLTLDAVRQLIAQLVDVARAHQEQEIARADQALEHLARRLEVARVGGVWHLVREVRGLYARRVLLARAVDVEHEHLVRALERTREVIHQRRQARVAVWLEDDDQPAVTQFARRFDGRAHLGRGMRVVVVDGRALEDAQELHAPVRAGE